ncbi:MAG: alpha/beta fold hydrolase [Ktedonobacteraceae bacterium]
MSTTNIPVSSNHTANTNISSTVQRPPWLDEQLYPFQSHFVEVEGNPIHYIDEGSGPIVLFVHPGFGWSFMYSDIIKELRGRFRCVALDLPGFGLSPAVPGYQHTLTGDSWLLEQFIQALGLTDVTLFSHDVTGSIALGVVARRPEWFRAVVVLPSFAWPVESYRKVYPMIQLVGSPIFRFLSYRFNFFLEYTLKTITKKTSQPFSDLEKQAYRGPNLDRAVRRYPHDLFKSVTKSHDYLADLEQRLSAIKKMPVLLIFGDVDGSIKMGWLARLERIFPQHRTIIMKDCHHFPQVYDALGVAAAIRSWWDEEIA